MYRGEEWRGSVTKSAMELLREKVAKRELKAVDHSAIDYIPIRKALYVESREVAALSALESLPASAACRRRQPSSAPVALRGDPHLPRARAAGRAPGGASWPARCP